jgi:riboflavin kinase / FMN adenylyltransferase
LPRRELRSRTLFLLPVTPYTFHPPAAVQIIRSANELGSGSKQVCAAIGVFDGLHLGHQAVLGRARADAAAVDGMLVAVTFDRHPNSVVAPERTPSPIYRLEQKLGVLEALGVDVTWLIPFDRAFSRIEAEEFVRRLARDFAPLHSLSVGAGFTFGHRRGGNLDLLERLGREIGFRVHGLAAVEVGGEAVSSTRIREAIRSGDLAAAAGMLGRPYSVAGPVVRGDQLGRRLGFATANLAVTELVLPPDGVYAAEVRLDGRTCPAVLNIGCRPTVQQGVGPRQFEVHLLEFDGDLYGREFEVVFRRRLRDERRFANLPELEAQIRRDVESARAVLGLGPKES